MLRANKGSGGQMGRHGGEMEDKKKAKSEQACDVQPWNTKQGVWTRKETCHNIPFITPYKKIKNTYAYE